MILFRRCRIEHIRLIRPQKDQEGEARYNVPLITDMVDDSVAMSCWENERCIAAAGVYPVWPGRAVAWALLSDDARAHMRAIVRHMVLVLHSFPAARIEMTVAAGFMQSHKLAQLMGFTCETPNGMTYFFPDGKAGYLYALVKPWQ